MMSIQQLKQRVAAVEHGVARAQTGSAGLDLVTVRRAVAEELATVVDVAAEHVAESHSLPRQYGLTALGHIELALALEQRLGIARLADACAWRTVGDVVRDVMRAQGAG